jgi:hypothetical protein
MMKQVLAIFALLVAGSHAATCTVASVQTGNTIAAADSSSLAVGATNRVTAGCQTSGGLTGVAFPNAAGRCSVMCDGTLGVAASAAIPTANVYVAFNPFDTTYGNSVIDAANVVTANTAAYQYGGAQSTCSGTSTAVANNAACYGANYFVFTNVIANGGTAGTNKIGLTDTNAYTTHWKAAIDCATFAMFDTSICRIASATQITIKNGFTPLLVTSSGTTTIVYKIAVHNEVLTAAALKTWSDTAEASDAALLTAFKASAAALVLNAGTSPYTGTEQVGTAATVATGAVSTIMGFLNAVSAATGTALSAATGNAKVGVTATYHISVDGTPARYIANGNQGAGDYACGTSVPNLGCLHGCDVGYTRVGTVASYVLPDAKPCQTAAQTSTTNGLAAAGMPACNGGTSVGATAAAALTRAFTAGTCEASYGFTKTITMATSGTGSVADNAAYIADSFEIQRQTECAMIQMATGTDANCVLADASVASADMTVKKGITMSCTWATGGVVTCTGEIASSVASRHAVKTNLDAITATTWAAKVVGSTIKQSTNYAWGGADPAAGIFTIGTTTPTFCALNEQTWDLTGVTLQTNSSTGNCGNFLANGGTCTPVCGTGYSTASGTVSCSSSGVLTGYNCSVAPTPTPTSNATSCTYGATSTCATRVTQSLVISSLTVAAYTGNTKAVYECGYTKSVTSTWCTATTGAVTYLSGVQISSTAAARRAATLTFVLDVETSVMTAANVQTAVAAGVTASNLVDQMTAIATASGWSVTVPALADITVNTATFAGAASGAGALVPSALAALAGVASLLMM